MVYINEMSEVSVETASVHKEGLAGAPFDEDGECGDEVEGFPQGSEKNNGDEVWTEANVDDLKPAKTTTASSSTRTFGSSSRSGSKSHKSGSERRRKHHHRHHHSSGGNNSRSEKRSSRRKSAAALSSSVGDARDGSEDRDRDDGRDALSWRLGQAGEEDGTTFVESSRSGSSSSSRRRSDSFGDGKSGEHHRDNYDNNNQQQQVLSPRKMFVSSSSHDHHSSTKKRKDSSDDGPEGEGGGGRSGEASRSNRRKEHRESHHSSKKEREKGGGGSTAMVAKDDDNGEAEDGEILEDGELDDDEDADGEERPDGNDERSERNEREESLSKSGHRSKDKYSSGDHKRSSVDFRDRWKRDADDKKRNKKLYNNASDNDERDVRSSTSPPSGSVAGGGLPAWGSGVSQAVLPKASPSSGNAGPGGHSRNKSSSQGSRYGKSGGYGGQSPPGLYDSPSYSEDSEDGMMNDGYMDADDKDYEGMRTRRARKRGRDLMSDRKRGGPPRKKTLMEMSMSERPICKFYMDGKCAKGSGCQFNHDIDGPRLKMEVCKYHLTVKGCHKEHCLYMHENYPCKYYHTGAKCFSGDRCKFSHAPLTEETRQALALRVAEADIVDMEDPDYRDYPSRDYEDNNRDYDRGDYDDSRSYEDARNRPSLLGSPPRNRKIPSLFEIKVTPPGPSPKAGNVPPAGSAVAGNTGVLNNAMGVGLISNNSMNQQQQQQQQAGMRPGLLGPGGPLPARTPNAAMLLSMQQQQQQMVRPGFGLAGAAPPFIAQATLNNLQQQQRGLNTANNGGNLPPVLNMLGSLIQNLQNGPGSVQHGNMNMMASQNNIGQNMNNVGNKGQNNMGNMGQNNMGNMVQNMQNGMGLLGNMPPSNMSNMGANMANRNSMPNIGPNGQINNIGMTVSPVSMNMTNPNIVSNVSSANAMSMGQLQAMGPGRMRLPMQQAACLNTMGNVPVSAADMYNNSGFNPSSNVGPVSNPGQEVGIKDVDYRVGQQQPQGMPGSKVNSAGDGEQNAGREGKGLVEEEDSNQDLGELDKMRQQLEEQLRAEDERAAAEADSFEEEEVEGRGSLSESREPPEEVSVKKDAESAAPTELAKETAKTGEPVVEIPSYLPRKQRELLKRIQQQEISRQREKERQEAAEKVEAEARAAQEAQAKAEVDDFYSSDEEGESGTEKKPKLTDVLKKLSQETSSATAANSSLSTAIRTATSSSSVSTAMTTNGTTAATVTSSAPSTFNIMQMIQAIKSKTGTTSLRDQTNSETQQVNSDSKKTVLASPASPPASPTDKDQTSVGLGLRLQPLTVDPPVVSARPSRPLSYSVIKLSLSQARPYSHLPAGVIISDPRFRSDPRVKWNMQYMERQLKKKASLAGEFGIAQAVEVTHKASLDEDIITSPSPTQDTVQKPADPRLKKADPRLQKAGASPNSSGSTSTTKAVDPRLERAANRPTDPRLAARAVDPRLNRQNSLPATAQGGFNNQMGMMNSMAGNINPMGLGTNGPIQGNPQMNMNAMQGQMGGFRGNQMGMCNQIGGPGQMGGLSMNSAGPRDGPMNMSNMGISNVMSSGMNRMGLAGPAGMNMGMGSVNSQGNQLSGSANSIGMRPQLQGGIFVSGGGDMSTLGAAARAGLSGQMMNSTPPNMQGPGNVAAGNLDPRLGGGPRPQFPSVMPNDPRLKNRANDPRDPRDSRNTADPRDPRSGFNNPKDPRSRDPRDLRSGRQFINTADMNHDPGSIYPEGQFIEGNISGANKLGWPGEEDKSFSQGDTSFFGNNNPPDIPASLSQPPQSSLPSSLSLNLSSFSSSTSPPQSSTSTNTEKPSGVPANFDHRNDPRFKRVKRSAGPRADSMTYSSPLGGEQQDQTGQSSNTSNADTLNYNSYNRPKPTVQRHVERHIDTPSPTLPDTLEDFDMPETVPQLDVPVKDIFKSIDPTASPFC